VNLPVKVNENAERIDDAKGQSLLLPGDALSYADMDRVAAALNLMPDTLQILVGVRTIVDPASPTALLINEIESRWLAALEPD
jgi:hypothetical protein